MSLDQALDAYADTLASKLGLRVTRKPGTVIAPCVYLAPPSLRALTGHVLAVEVPAYLIAPGNGGDESVAYLTAHAIAFQQTTRAEIVAVTLALGDDDYPAYQATPTISVPLT